MAAWNASSADRDERWELRYVVQGWHKSSVRSRRELAAHKFRISNGSIKCLYDTFSFPITLMGEGLAYNKRLLPNLLDRI